MGEKMSNSGVLDQIRLDATIYNNTGSGTLTSCIDGPYNAASFKTGMKVAVYPSWRIDLRGTFTVSYVESLMFIHRRRGYKWYEHINRLWSSDPLPEGTKAGDYLLAESNE